MTFPLLLSLLFAPLLGGKFRNFRTANGIFCDDLFCLLYLWPECLVDILVARVSWVWHPDREKSKWIFHLGFHSNILEFVSWQCDTAVSPQSYFCLVMSEKRVKDTLSSRHKCTHASGPEMRHTIAHYKMFRIDLSASLSRSSIY